MFSENAEKVCDLHEICKSDRDEQTNKKNEWKGEWWWSGIKQPVTFSEWTHSAWRQKNQKDKRSSDAANTFTSGRHTQMLFTRWHLIICCFFLLLALIQNVIHASINLLIHAAFIHSLTDRWWLPFSSHFIYHSIYESSFSPSGAGSNQILYSRTRTTTSRLYASMHHSRLSRLI